LWEPLKFAEIRADNAGISAAGQEIAVVGKQIFLIATLAAMSTQAAYAAPAPPATKADVQALQVQMQALVERLNRLEGANAELQIQNQELRAVADRRAAEVDYLKTQTSELSEQASAGTKESNKLKAAEWASRIRARGDFRYRHEAIWSEREVDGVAEDAADRSRDRIRARIGFDATVTENVSGALLLSTGGDDPRGTNQTLGGESSRKSIGLDLAYADWRITPGSNLVLGKQPYPVWRPLRSLFLDADVNPEGGALRFRRGPVFANVFGFWLSEQYSADPAGDNSDAHIFGAQAGVKFAMFGGETTLATKYLTCSACKDQSPLFANNANGNTTYRVGTVNVLQYDYDVLDIEAQAGTTILNLPVEFTAGFARNLADGVEYDTAYSFGVNLGQAAAPHTWEVGALYQSVDKDALFGQVVDSDFGGGQTDSQGWVFRGGYAPVKNVLLTAVYYLTTFNKDVGTELAHDRLQLDVNYKF